MKDCAVSIKRVSDERKRASNSHHLWGIPLIIGCFYWGTLIQENKEDIVPAVNNSISTSEIESVYNQAAIQARLHSVSIDDYCATLEPDTASHKVLAKEESRHIVLSCMPN